MGWEGSSVSCTVIREILSKDRRDKLITEEKIRVQPGRDLGPKLLGREGCTNKGPEA